LGQGTVAGIDGFGSNTSLMLAPWIARTCIPLAFGGENTTVMLSAFSVEVVVE